jgi:hypothetical protein
VRANVLTGDSKRQASAQANVFRERGPMFITAISKAPYRINPKRR